MELFGEPRKIKPIWPHNLFTGYEGLQAYGRHLLFEHVMHVGSVRDDGDHVFSSAGAQWLYERVTVQFRLEEFYLPVFVKVREEEIDGEKCDVGYQQYFASYIPVPWGWEVGNKVIQGKEALAKWISDLIEVEDIKTLPKSDGRTRFVPISAEFQEQAEDDWSDPVQVKIVEGELVMRRMKQIAGVEDSGYEAWAPTDGLSA